MFPFLVNFAEPKRDEKSIGEYITAPKNKREPMPVMNIKWVDGLSLFVSVNLMEEAVKGFIIYSITNEQLRFNKGKSILE